VRLCTLKSAQKWRDVEVGQDQIGLGLKIALKRRLAFDLKLRDRQAVLRGEIGNAALGVRDDFQGAGGLASQDQVAQMNPSQNGGRIERAGGVGIKLLANRPWRVWSPAMGKMSQFKVGPIQMPRKFFVFRHRYRCPPRCRLPPGR